MTAPAMFHAQVRGLQLFANPHPRERGKDPGSCRRTLNRDIE